MIENERTRLARIPADEYQSFLDNDMELAYEYGNNKEFLKKNNAEFK